MINKKEITIKEVAKAVVTAWTDVGKALLGPCGGQEDDSKLPKNELPKDRSKVN